MTTISSVKSLTLDQPPSCIAFCQRQPQYFVIGTYLLHSEAEPTTVEPIDDGTHEQKEPPQKRTGSLELYRLENDTITHVSTTIPNPPAAILDIQWSPHAARGAEVLAVAESSSMVQFYLLITSGATPTLTYTSWLPYQGDDEDDGMALSLSWHPIRRSEMAVTTASGRVYFCDAHAGGDIWPMGTNMTVESVHRHELEAWTVVLYDDENEPGSTIMLSGGDDSYLRYSYLVRKDNNDDDDPTRLVHWENRNLHDAGVTAILPIASDLVVTGSYDERIRLITCPAGTGGRPRVLAEHSLEGGVWRLRMLGKTRFPSSEGAGSKSGKTTTPELDGRGSNSLAGLVILASCMHAGARVVRLAQDRAGDWAFEVLAKFEEHKSMNYGSDVQPGEGRLKTIVSTSFYDKLLCLWRFDLGNGG